MGAKTVDFTFGLKGQTFIAECIGGPHHGKLARAPVALKSVLIRSRVLYRRVARESGEGFVWKFESFKRDEIGC